MHSLKSFKLISCSPAVLVLGVLLWFPAVSAQESEAEKQFQYARQLAADGLVDLAVEQYTEFLRLYGDSPLAPQALFNLAQGLEGMSSWGEAARRYRQLLIRYPAFPRCDEALYAVHKNQIKAGEQAEAVTGLERFPLFYPDSPLAAQALLDAGDLHLEGQAFVQAEENWQRLLEEYAGSNLIDAARFRLANLYHRQRKLGPAQSQIDRLLDGDPKGDDLARVGLTKAGILADRYDLNQAEALYEMLMGEKLSEAWQQRVRVAYSEHLLRIGDFARSETVLSPVLAGRAAQRDTEALAVWIRLKEQVNDDQAVLEAVGRLMASPGDSTQMASALFSGAAAARRQGETEQAIDFLTRLLAIEKSRGLAAFEIKSIYSQMLHDYRELGWTADALRIGDVAINRFADEDEFVNRIQFALGIIHLEDLKQPRNALFFFERILSPVHLSSLADDAAFKQAACYDALGDRDTARRLLREFIAVYPASPFAADARARLKWYRNYEPEDPAAELRRTSALFSQLLLKAEREKTLLALIEQSFFNMRAYELAIEQIAMVEEEKLLRNKRDHLDRLAGESHYRIAVRGDDPDQSGAHLGRAREYLLKYLAAGPPPAEELRVARIILDIDQRSGKPGAAEQRSRAAMRALLAKYPGEPGAAGLRLQLAGHLTSLEPDSAQAAIVLYDQVLASAPAQSDGDGAAAAGGADAHERALYGRAQARLAAGDTAAAMLDFTAYKETYPQGQFMMLVREACGAIDLAAQRYDAAESNYEAIVGQFYYAPQMHAAKLTLARIKLDQGAFAEALSLLDNLAEAVPAKRGDVVFMTGMAYFGLGDHAAARRCFSEYLLENADGPFVADVYLKLAELGKLAARPGETSLNQERFLNRFPDDPRGPQILMDLADRKFAAGDYAGARDDYVKLQTDPRVVDVQELRRKTIVAMIRAGEVAGAQRLISQFEDSYKDAEGDLVLIQFELGSHYIDEKFFDGAEKLFEKLASRYRKTEYAGYGEYGLGKLRLVTNKTEEALEILTGVIDRYPETPMMANLLMTLGDFYYKNKQPQSAMSAFERCLALQPDRPLDVNVRRYLIQVYGDLGFYEADIRAIREFLERYPDDANAFAYRITIGVNLKELNEYHRAIDQFRSLLARANNEEAAEIRYHIGDCYFLMGQFRRSVSEFLKVNYLTRPTKLPWHVTARYRSGMAYLKLEEWDKARLLFNQIVKQEGAESEFGRFAQAKLAEIEQVSGNE